MANPPINISSMDFAEIKKSLVNYLKNQTYFNSYNFESSALSTLVNILSYNTMFYTYYANMIANETFLGTSQIPENVLSIIRPLGYVVNGVNSSKITVNLKGDGTAITAYTTLFTAVNSLGVNYRFYSIKDYTLNTLEDTEVILYNANTLVKDKVINDPNAVLLDKINLETQSYYIGAFDIDINTVTVKVNSGSGYQTWTRFDPNNPSTTAETNKIYFIERRDNGFYLLFSRSTLDDIFGFTEGLTIGSNDLVTISYIKPVGENANNSALTSVVGTPTDSTISSGGGVPDLDIIKSFAPKLFAASDRAVTKDDYYGVILNSNLVPPSITIPEQIIVWGGEELRYPLPGRSFYSFADPSIGTDNVKSLTNLLKQKGMMTIIPEYIPAKQLTINSTFQLIGTPTAALIKSELETLFNGTLQFNRIFSNTELALSIKNKYPAVSLLDITGTNIQFSLNSFTNKIELFNQLRTPSSITSYGTAFITNTFTYEGASCTFRDYKNTEISSTKGIIVIYNETTRAPLASSEVGTIDYATGEIYINKKYIPESAVTCTAIPNNNKLLTSKFNNLFVLNATVNK